MRIKNIILTDLVSEQLKCQEQIERLLNSGDNLNYEVEEIKVQLRTLVLIESMIDKWKVMVMNPPIGEKDKNNG